MRRIRRGARGLAVVVVLAGISSVVTPVLLAHAQTDFVESDPAVVRAREQLAGAQAAAHQAADALTQNEQERDATQQSIDEHVAQIQSLDQQRADLATQRDALRTVMRARAVALYRNGGTGGGLDAIVSSSSVLQAARRQALSDAAASSNARAASQLEHTRTQLAAVQNTLRDEQAQLDAQRARLDQLAASLEQRRSELEHLVAAANDALARARVIGALHAAGEPVMGPATLTASQLAGWVRSQGFSPRINADLTELAQIFLDEGRDENVRGDLAFAQSVIETGGFESAPANNYSGIGWCDSCAKGNTFPTPREGVRAQIQLLRQYADAGVTAVQLSHPVSPYLYGSDPANAVRRFDTFFARGWAPTWSDMGHGNWATDPNYSQKVIGVYRRMVTYSQSR